VGVLGVHLALAKWVFATGGHRWIGADFCLRQVPQGWAAVVRIPDAFAAELFDLLSPFAKGTGHLGKTQVEQALGKAGRLAYVVPSARPFVTALWGAFEAARLAARQRRKEAPPGRFAAQRFAKAARWLQTLLKPGHGQGQPLQDPDPSVDCSVCAAPHHLLPLELLILPHLQRIDPTHALVQFDASPWGGGAALWEQGRLTQWFAITWDQAMAQDISERIGEAKGQTTWEYLALFLSLLCWGTQFRSSGLAIAGDNTGALSNALSLKGKRGMTRVSCELSWRKVRFGWRFSVAHLPSEENGTADALSRLAAPEGSDRKALPAAVRDARRVQPPSRDTWWHAS